MRTYIRHKRAEVNNLLFPSRAPERQCNFDILKEVYILGQKKCFRNFEAIIKTNRQTEKERGGKNLFLYFPCPVPDLI